MALRPLNSVGGFSVGEIPQTIIDGNGNVTANFATFSGNLLISNATASWGVLTDNLYYSNGQPWDLQEAAGSNNQIQFNSDDNFAASANLTFDPATNLLTVIGNAQFNNANLGNLATANYVNVSSNVVTNNLTVNTSLSGNTANFSGNVVVPNLAVNLELSGNTANFSGNVSSNNLSVTNDLDANNITITSDLDANTANFSGNVVVPNLTVNLELAGNTANFSGNISALNANLGNLVTANYVNAAVDVNATGNVSANNASIGSGNIDLYANGEIDAATANFSGNVYASYFVGNISGNLTITAPNTTVIYSANGAAVGSNAFTFDYVGNVLTVDGTANITGNAAVGAILTDNYYYANGAPVDFQQPAGSNTQIQFNDNSDFGASANLTFDFSTQTLGVVGLVNITGNANVSDTINGNVANFSGNLTSLNANLGNLATANYVNVANDLNGNVANFSGNLTAQNANLGNLVEANFVNVASNVVTSNLTVNLELAGNTANFTGNISALNANLGNLVEANYVNVAQQINGNVANFSGNLTVLNANLGNLATANYVNVANDLNVVGNVNAGNLVGPLANGTSNIRILQDANIELSSNGVSNIVTISDTGLFTSGNIHSTAGYIIANGNVTANGFLVGANAVVTGEANLSSVLTSNITSNGNLTITASGTDVNINLVPGGPNGVIEASLARIAQVGGPTQPNDAATKEYVDSTSVGLTIHQPVVATSTTNLNATYANGGSVLTTIAITGGKTIQFGANHNLSIGDELAWDNSFNGIIGNDPYFVYSTPGADTITVKAGYFGAEVTTLTNGTGLSQTARANTGVGATLTNAGANAAIQIDSVSLASTNRVLVQGQTNQFENGVYTVTTVGNGSTAWVLTRAPEEDTYSPKSTTGMGYGDYFFVQQGTNNAGSSYSLTSPVGEILFGLTNIQYSQFSAAGSYTAGNGIAINGTVISANVDNDTTAISAGNIVVKTGANLVTPNIGDATFSSLTWNTLSNGNVSANNLSISSIANITLDLTVGGNIQANGTISSNANVSGLNLTTSGNVQATGNVLANNVTANTLLTVPTANVSNIVNAGNVDITYALTGNTANFAGNIIVNNATVNLELAGNTANFSGNIVAGNISTSGSGGNITGANVVSANTFSGNLEATYANVTGNVTGGNLVTSGTANVAVLNVTGNVSSDLLPNANLTHDLGNATLRWDTVYAGNLDASGNLTIGGDIEANNFTANVLTANTEVVIGNTAINWSTVTTTSITANQAIAQAPFTGVTGIEYIVKGEDSTGAKYSMATVQAVTDGSNVDYATFGTVYIGGTTGTLSVAISGSNLVLQVTPSSSNSTLWTTQYRLI
jgi:hypothetical protein